MYFFTGQMPVVLMYFGIVTVYRDLADVIINGFIAIAISYSIIAKIMAICKDVASQNLSWLEIF